MYAILLCDSEDIEATVRLCGERGFGVEFQLFSWPTLDDDQSQVSRRKLVADQVKLRSIHGPFADLCPGSSDPMVQGVARYRIGQAFGVAEELGADSAMAVKGVEVPMHEPRGKQGLGISYATSPRGANHMEGMHDTMLERDAPTPELGVNRAYDRFTLADKAAVACLYENLRSFTNSLVLCCFTTSTVGEDYNFPAIRSLLDAATGLALTSEEMLRIGERNYALMRLHAARAGYTAEQDGLPERFFEPLPRGASANHPIDRGTFHVALEAYYQERGYDRFGPTEATLRNLGMEDCTGVIAR